MQERALTGTNDLEHFKNTSFQLEPMNFQLPGEVQSGSQVQKTVMPQFTRSFVFDRQTRYGIRLDG